MVFSKIQYCIIIISTKNNHRKTSHIVNLQTYYYPNNFRLCLSNRRNSVRFTVVNSCDILLCDFMYRSSKCNISIWFFSFLNSMQEPLLLLSLFYMMIKKSETYKKINVNTLSMNIQLPDWWRKNIHLNGILVNRDRKVWSDKLRQK